ncbi:Pr6Pr family membrane protein [Cyclobacterium sediminis]
MKKNIELFASIIVWFAVLAQFYLMIINRQAGIIETIVRFFSFFTILTNTLVALYFTSKAFKLKKFPFSIFHNTGALTAITTFILIVGLVYQIALRGIWQPTGFQYLIDELLHSIVPLWVLIYWFMNVAKFDLKFKSVSYWILYPICYLLFVLIRGHFSGFYPYPFLNISIIGYLDTFQNIGLIIFLFLFILALLVFLGKKLPRNRGIESNTN